MGLALGEGVELPITGEIHNVLYEDGNPMAALKALMSRAPKEETLEYQV